MSPPTLSSLAYRTGAAPVHLSPEVDDDDDDVEDSDGVERILVLLYVMEYPSGWLRHQRLHIIVCSPPSLALDWATIMEARRGREEGFGLYVWRS